MIQILFPLTLFSLTFCTPFTSFYSYFESNLLAIRGYSRKFIATSAKYIDKMMATTAYPLPELGKVRFYVLTPNSIYTYEAAEPDLRKNVLSPLYAAGHHVLAELLATAQKK